MERRQQTAWLDWIGTISGAGVISVDIIFVQGTYSSIQHSIGESVTCKTNAMFGSNCII